MRDIPGRKLLIATHNSGKLREIRDLLGPLGFDVTSAAALGLDEPAETEDTFAGNARIKAHFAAEISGSVALSDDSGIEVDALDGAPGVYTADWAETPKGRNFGMAMQTVWDKCENAHAPQPRTARFRCTLCLAWPDGQDLIFDGAVEGCLVWPPRGDNGFGFDPMFLPDGHAQTFGEMHPASKHSISHRAVAFAKLVAALGNG